MKGGETGDVRGREVDKEVFREGLEVSGEVRPEESDIEDDVA